jgi:hypothetical protein
MLVAVGNPGGASVNNQVEQFFKALVARKTQSLTQQQIDRISHLSKTKQHFVMEMLDRVITQAGH